MSSDQLYVPRARFRPELFLFALRDAVCALGHQDEHSLPVSAASVLDSSCQQFVLASTILDVPGSSPLDSGSNSSKQNAHAHLVRQAAAWQAHCNETVSPGSPFLAVMRELVTSIKDDPHSPLPLASSAAKATGARAPGTSLFSSHESPLNRWVLLSFFPLVRAVQLVADHAGVTLNLHADVLGLLVAVLRDVPPFAFASEPADNMDTVQTMLLNQAALEVDPNRKCSVMSAVLALATQRGSLAPLLHVACELVKEHASSSKTGGPEFFIDAGPSISHLFEHCSPSVGVIAHPAALLSRFSVDHVAKDISLHVPKSAQDTSDADPLVLAPVRDWRRAVLLPAEYASQAVLGGFLFRHTRTGLTKVGTGVDGTITGLVYAHRADFMPQTVCSLVVIGHRLFIGFAGCASLAVEVHVDTLLETGCVLHPPAESGAAHDQSRMFSYGSQLFLFRVASAVDVCVERFNCPTQTELSPNLARSCPSIPLQFPWSHVTNLSQFSVAHLPSVIDALGLLFDGRLIHVVVPARFISEAMLSTLATSFTAPMLPTENQIRSIQAVQLRFDASKGSFQGVSILRVSPDSGPSRTLVMSDALAVYHAATDFISAQTPLVDTDVVWQYKDPSSMQASAFSSKDTTGLESAFNSGLLTYTINGDGGTVVSLRGAVDGCAIWKRRASTCTVKRLLKPRGDSASASTSQLQSLSEFSFSAVTISSSTVFPVGGLRSVCFAQDQRSIFMADTAADGTLSVSCWAYPGACGIPASECVSSSGQKLSGLATVHSIVKSLALCRDARRYPSTSANNFGVHRNGHYYYCETVSISALAAVVGLAENIAAWLRFAAFVQPAEVILGADTLISALDFVCVCFEELLRLPTSELGDYWPRLKALATQSIPDIILSVSAVIGPTLTTQAYRACSRAIITARKSLFETSINEFSRLVCDVLAAGCTPGSECSAVHPALLLPLFQQLAVTAASDLPLAELCGVCAESFVPSTSLLRALLTADQAKLYSAVDALSSPAFKAPASDWLVLSPAISVLLAAQCELLSFALCTAPTSGTQAWQSALFGHATDVLDVLQQLCASLTGSDADKHSLRYLWQVAVVCLPALFGRLTAAIESRHNASLLDSAWKLLTLCMATSDSMSQCMSLITKLSVTLPASFFADLSDAHRLLCVFVAVVLRERYRGSQGTSDPSPSVLDTLPCSGGFLESDLQWQPSPAVLTSVFQTIQAHFNVNPVTIRGSAKPAAERAQASVFLACVWHTGAAHELSVLAAEVVAGKLPSPRSVAASLHAPFMASLQAMCHVQAYGEQVVIWRHLLDEVRGTVRASGDGDAAVVEPKKLLLDRIRDLNDTSLQRICELQSVVFLPQDPGSCIGRLVDKAAVLLSATDMQDSSPAACYASVADDIVSRADLLMKFSSAALASSGDGHNAVSNKLVRSASKTHTTSLQHSASFSRAQSVRALAPTQLARSATESSHDAFSSSELSSTGFVSTAMQQVELHRVLSSGSLTVADRPSATASLAGYASDMVSLGLCIERRRGLNAVPVLNVQAAVAQLCLDLTCPPVAELANLAQARKSLATCRLDSLHSLNVLLSRSPRLPDSIIVDVLAITCVTVAAPSTDCFDGIRGAGLPVLQELVLARAQVWTTILSIACDEKSADSVIMSCVRFLRQQLLPCDALVLSNSKALTQLAERLTLPSPHVVLVELFWSLCWTVLSWATVVRMDATAWQLESMFRAVSLVQTSALECVAKFMAHALVAPDLSEAGAGARTSKLRSDPPSDSKDDAPFEQESKDDTSFCASRFASVGMPQSASSSHGSVWQGLLMFLGARHTQAGVAFLQCDAAVILAIRLFRLTRMFCLKVQRLLIRFLRDVLTCASASAIETALLMVDADFTLADFCQMLLEFIGHSLVGDNVVASEPLPSETPNSLSPAVSAPAMMHIVQRLFAKDGASHLELPDVDEKMWSLCIRKTSAASDCTARVFMEASMDAVISAIGSPDSTESSGMSWPARGWHGGREELDDFVLSGLERSGVGPVVRAATLKSCTVVAARLALYGFVTEIVPDTVMLRLCGKEALESSSKAGSGPKSSRRLHAAATVELGMSRNQSAAQAGLASESTDATVVAHASLFMVYEVVYLYRCILSGASPVSVGQVSHFSPPRPPRKSLKATARNILAANVSQLSLLAEQSSCIPSTAHQSIGALLVLGGEGACPIGVGSRVQLPENALGVVIAFIEGTSHADVLIDGADAVSVWSISDISVLPAVPCPPAHVVLTLLDVETDPEGSFAILDTFAHVLPLLTNVASGASPDYVRSILASRTLSVLLSMAQRSSFALSKCVSHQVLGRTIEGLLHSKIDLPTLSDARGAEMECLRAAFLRRRAMMTDSGAAPLKDEPAVPSPIASVAIPSCIDVDYGRDAALMGGSHTTALVVSHQGAFIRADAPILLALPDYYFEVTVKSLPTEAPKIGLWAVPQSKAALSSCVSSRAKKAFKYVAPRLSWSRGSLIWDTKDSQLRCIGVPLFETRSFGRQPGASRAAEPFFSGTDQQSSRLYDKDVVVPAAARVETVFGCGWSLERGSVFFTRNGDLVDGELVLPELRRAPGQADSSYVPAVEVACMGTIVSFNFGATAFQYTPPWLPAILESGSAQDAFAATVAARLETSQSAETCIPPDAVNAIVPNRVLEVCKCYRRRPLAENMQNSIFPHLTLDQLMTALSKNGDNPDRTSMWCFSNQDALDGFLRPENSVAQQCSGKSHVIIRGSHKRSSKWVKHAGSELGGAIPPFPGLEAPARFMAPTDGCSDASPRSLAGCIALVHRSARIHPAVAARRAQAAGAIAVAFLCETEDVASLVISEADLSSDASVQEAAAALLVPVILLAVREGQKLSESLLTGGQATIQLACGMVAAPKPAPAALPTIDLSVAAAGGPRTDGSYVFSATTALRQQLLCSVPAEDDVPSAGAGDVDPEQLDDWLLQVDRRMAQRHVEPLQRREVLELLRAGDPNNLARVILSDIEIPPRPKPASEDDGDRTIKAKFRQISDADAQPGCLVCVSPLAKQMLSSSSSGSSKPHWIPELDQVLGQLAVIEQVEAPFPGHTLLLLRFVDVEASVVCRWWLPTRVVCLPPADSQLRALSLSTRGGGESSFEALTSSAAVVEAHLASVTLRKFAMLCQLYCAPTGNEAALTFSPAADVPPSYAVQESATAEAAMALSLRAIVSSSELFDLCLMEAFSSLSAPSLAATILSAEVARSVGVPATAAGTLPPVLMDIARAFPHLLYNTRDIISSAFDVSLSVITSRSTLVQSGSEAWAPAWDVRRDVTLRDAPASDSSVHSKTFSAVSAAIMTFSAACSLPEDAELCFWFDKQSSAPHQRCVGAAANGPKHAACWSPAWITGIDASFALKLKNGKCAGREMTGTSEAAAEAVSLTLVAYEVAMCPIPLGFWFGCWAVQAVTARLLWAEHYAVSISGCELTSSDCKTDDGCVAERDSKEPEAEAAPSAADADVACLFGVLISAISSMLKLATTATVAFPLREIVLQLIVQAVVAMRSVQQHRPSLAALSGLPRVLDACCASLCKEVCDLHAIHCVTPASMAPSLLLAICELVLQLRDAAGPAAWSTFLETHQPWGTKPEPDFINKLWYLRHVFTQLANGRISDENVVSAAWRQAGLVVANVVETVPAHIGPVFDAAAPVSGSVPTVDAVQVLSEPVVVESVSSDPLVVLPAAEVEEEDDDEALRLALALSISNAAVELSSERPASPPTATRENLSAPADEAGLPNKLPAVPAAEVAELSPRPPASSPEVAPSPPSGKADFLDPEARWICEVCTFVNRGSGIKCSICDAVRVEVADVGLPPVAASVPVVAAVSSPPPQLPPEDQAPTVVHNNIEAVAPEAVSSAVLPKQEGLPSIPSDACLAAARACCAAWSAADDAQIVRYLGALTDNALITEPLVNLSVHKLWALLSSDSATRLLQMFPRVLAFDPTDICRRFVVLQAVNRAFTAVTSLLDVESPAMTAPASSVLLLKRLLGTIPAVPLDLTQLASTSISALIKAGRALLFTEVKLELWNALVSTTADAERSQRARIGVNRLLNAGASATGVGSVFEQACKQLFDTPASRLRQASASPHLAFDVALHGEHVVGEAGPYRAFFADVCAEVLTGRRLSSVAAPESMTSSAVIPLFVTVPNAQMSHGENRDRWLIRYACNTQEHLKHFEFLGRLFGAALRTRVLLPLSLPRLFWRPLVGLPHRLDDLEAIALSLVQGVIVPLRNCSTPEQFDEVFRGGVLKWRVKLADGSLVNLRDFVTDDSSSQLLVVTGGDVDSVAQLTGWELAAHWDSDGDAEPSATRATAASAFVPPEAVVFHEADVLGEGDSVQGDDDDDTVTFDERLVFATALESAWLHQQDSQLRALLSGIAQVVPAGVFSLFTEAELERLACGRATIDIALLKRHTEYAGVSADAQHIAYFWQVLEEFSQEERRRFIKFAWAQERLPSSDEDFERYPRTRMMIKAYTGRQPPVVRPPARSRSRSGSGSGSEDDQSNSSPAVPEAPTPSTNVDQVSITADTCFFNIMLPAYSSLDVMRRQLMSIVAVDEWGMDGDDVVLDEHGEAHSAPTGQPLSTRRPTW